MNILEKSLKLVDEIFTKESIEKLKNEFYNYIDRVTEKPNNENNPVNRTEEMGDRLKNYESNSENVLDKDKPIIIRIDGNLCTRSRLKRTHINLSTYSEDLVKLIKVKHIWGLLWKII